MADLIRRQVALIVGNTPAALAAKAATTTVPIVFATGADPVRDGLVASLNRPGGNVTGVSFLSACWGEATGAAAPVRPKATISPRSGNPNRPDYRGGATETCWPPRKRSGSDSIILDVSSDREIETAFTTLVQRGAGALLVGTGDS